MSEERQKPASGEAARPDPVEVWDWSYGPAPTGPAEPRRVRIEPRAPTPRPRSDRDSR